MTNFLVSYSFTAAGLWLMAMGIFWHVGSKVLQENWRRQKWERQWLKMCSSLASPQGRTELTTSYGSNPWHPWQVSDLRGSLQFLCWWPGETRAALLQKSNLIAQGRAALPHFHLFLSFPQNYSETGLHGRFLLFEQPWTTPSRSVSLGLET